MPFKSEAQRRYLWANEPEIARDWADTYGSRIQKENGGIMRLGFQNGKGVDYNDIQLMAKVEELRMKYPWKYGDDVTDEELIKLIKENEGRDKTSSSNWLERGTNWTKQLPGMAFSALSGIPGLGFLLNAARPSPIDRYNQSRWSVHGRGLPGTSHVSSFAPMNYFDTLRHGNLTGQDPFGINTASMFGNYQKHYQDYLNAFNRGEKKGQFAIDKANYAKKVLGTTPSSSNIAGTPLITSTSKHRDRPDRPDRPDRRPDKPGGFTDPGKGSYGPHLKEGGLIDFYKNGGFSG